MMNFDEALRMAAMMAEAFAASTGLDCLCALAPAHDGVRWEVVAAESGARLAAGLVYVCVEASADKADDAPALSPARLALVN